jgi:endoglucanase
MESNEPICSQLQLRVSVRFTPIQQMPMHTRFQFPRVLPLLLLAACSSQAPFEPTASRPSTLTGPGLFLQGDNLSGAERGFGAAIEETWGPAIPGIEGQTYTWPTPSVRTLPTGMNIVRLPFEWERLQPTLNQDFDAAYVAKLRSTAGAWRDLGANVLLDVHNYAYYKVNGRGTTEPGQHIGSAEVPVAAFVDLWRRLALEFGSASTSSPYIFGLMNEPHDISVATWVQAAQGAVDAIRAAGAKNMIFVPGADWTTATDFSWSENNTLLQTVHDTLDNFAIEVHQYYDGVCTPGGYVDKLKPFEDWAVKNQRRAYLGELDVHETDECHQAFANLIDHLHATASGAPNGVWIGYTYWEGTNVANGLPFIQPHLPTTCASGAKDGAETDVDCGATCLRCANAMRCAQDYECQSGFCLAGVCSAAPSGGAGGASAGGASAGGAGTAGTNAAGGAQGNNAAGNGGNTSGGTSDTAGSAPVSVGGVDVPVGAAGAPLTGASAGANNSGCSFGVAKNRRGRDCFFGLLIGLGLVARRRSGSSRAATPRTKNA